jgi:hypothetical protein
MGKVSGGSWSQGRSLPEGQPLRWIYKVRQNYFTVYESNCGALGQIEDDDLRAAIIGAYVDAKGLLDNHLVNNDLFEAYQRAVRVPSDPGLIRTLEGELSNFGAIISDSYEQARMSVKTVLELMDRHGVKGANKREKTESSKVDSDIERL